jgi:hypothetical protein
MSRFTDYTTAATGLIGSGQSLETERTVELVDSTGALLATTSDADAVNGVVRWAAGGTPLDLDPVRTLSRTMTLRVAAGDVSLVPDGAGSLLHPESGNFVRIRAGLLGNLWTQATLLVDEAVATYRRGVVEPIELRLVDPGRPIRANLVDQFPWDDGELVETVVGRLLSIVLDDFDLTETGWTMPAAGSFPAGRPISELVQILLGSVGHELTADEDGRILSQQVPPTTESAGEQWIYGVEGGGLPVDSGSRRWSTRTPQGVLVSGGGLLVPGSSFTVPVWDTDPGSDGFYGGPGEVSIESVTWDHVGSPSQMVTAGYARLRRIGVGPALVDIEIAPNPAMRVGDMVALWLDGLGADGLYRVRSIGALPIDAGSLQQVTLRGVWDPQIGYGDPADPGLVCVSAASDPFDRANQNLEDLEDAPGSPRWTELAYSWAIYDSAAINRHNGTPSLAVWNTPLCSTDFVVYSQIGAVPAGKWIGPAGRSSGQFDCYAAVVDASGRIRLEMWQAGAKVTELAAYSTGQDPSNRSLVLACEGSTISVEWEGTEVLGVTDTRRVGAFAGMHSIGGVQGSSAPSISSWSVELL